MTIHLCTYFDRAFIARALALHASLRRHTPSFVLWALCLDEETADLVDALGNDDLRPISLSALEAFDPELAAVRPTRKPYEYYWTCTPSLLRFLLETRGEIDHLHYVDSDLYFFADAGAAVDAAGEASVAITPHRFSPRLAANAALVGTYNVGWLSVRDDPDGRACLDWWRAQCIDWCYDRLEPGRCGDQMYLDQFRERFEGVEDIAHPGVNVGHWNVERHDVTYDGSRVRVDEEPLIVYHFSGVRRLRGRTYVDGPFLRDRRSLTSVCRRHVFAPYLREIECAHRALAERGIHLEALSSAVDGSTRGERLRHLAGLIFGLPGALARGTVVRT